MLFVVLWCKVKAIFTAHNGFSCFSLRVFTTNQQKLRQIQRRPSKSVVVSLFFKGKHKKKPSH